MASIDAHTHAFAPGQVRGRAELVARDATFAEMYADPAAKMVSCDDIVRTISEAGIDAAVVGGFAFAAQRDIDELNAHVLGSAREHPGTIIPLATVNPILDGWVGAAERALDSGARGFGELRPHNQGWRPLSKEGRRLCELARERDIVLLWHVSEPVGHQYPGKWGGIRPEELFAVAEAFPGLRMVAAHLGGGLSFYLQMPEGRDVLRCVAYDTAASSLLYDDRSVARLAELAGPERVLFASDYPLQSPERQLQRIVGTLPASIVEAVCGGSARKFYLDTNGS
jgi:uncharacterized protein